MSSALEYRQRTASTPGAVASSAAIASLGVVAGR
jgi:hypothetical protein